MKLYASYKINTTNAVNVFECRELKLPVYKIFYNNVLVAVRCDRALANSKALLFAERLKKQFDKIGEI